MLKLMASKETNSAVSLMALGRCANVSKLSLMKFIMYLGKSFKGFSMNLLGRCVSQAGPAIIGLNVRLWDINLI